MKKVENAKVSKFAKFESKQLDLVQLQTVKGGTVDPPSLGEPVEFRTVTDPPSLGEPVEFRAVTDPPSLGEPVEF